MVLVRPLEAISLDDAVEFRLDVAGAESNVAVHLARAGLQVAWASAVGADPFGRRIIRSLVEAGVDVSAVRLDCDARTGIYFKDPGVGSTTVHYYRQDSAASRLGPGFVVGLPWEQARLVHLSGITPALSSSCRELVDRLLDERTRRGQPVSFDVNFRPGLWSAEVAGPVLRDLAARCDIVFVGRDEAEILWGTRDYEEVRRAGPSRHFVRAPVVDVVEPVGAGDAFAAGYLEAVLRAGSPEEALAQGHRFAARTMTSTADV